MSPAGSRCCLPGLIIYRLVVARTPHRRHQARPEREKLHSHPGCASRSVQPDDLTQAGVERVPRVGDLHEHMIAQAIHYETCKQPDDSK